MITLIIWIIEQWKKKKRPVRRGASHYRPVRHPHREGCMSQFALDRCRGVNPTGKYNDVC